MFVQYLQQRKESKLFCSLQLPSTSRHEYNESPMRNLPEHSEYQLPDRPHAVLPCRSRNNVDDEGALYSKNSSMKIRYRNNAGFNFEISISKLRSEDQVTCSADIESGKPVETAVAQLLFHGHSRESDKFDSLENPYKLKSNEKPCIPIKNSFQIANGTSNITYCNEKKNHNNRETSSYIMRETHATSGQNCKTNGLESAPTISVITTPGEAPPAGNDERERTERWLRESGWFYGDLTHARAQVHRCFEGLLLTLLYLCFYHKLNKAGKTFLYSRSY